MKLFRPAIVLTLFFVLVTGLAFPALVTAVAQGIFPHQANGSLVVRNGKVVGSEILGQNFVDARYFHLRPSAAGGGYDAANSSGTNLGPTSDKLLNGAEGFDGVKQLAEAYRKENDLAADVKIPADAVTRSASGLDPHISPANADLQTARVAKARNISVDKVKEMVRIHTDAAFLGVFGDSAVNVFALNRALDAAAPKG